MELLKKKTNESTKKLKYNPKFKKVAKNDKEFQELIVLQKRQISILERIEIGFEELKTIYNFLEKNQKIPTFPELYQIITKYLQKEQPNVNLLNIYQTGSRSWGYINIFNFLCLLFFLQECKI